MAGLLSGRLGLTEWAELEAHTAACETCDRALDHRYSDLFEERLGRERPVASRARRTALRVGIGVAAVLVLGALGVYASPRLLSEIPGTLRGLRLPELAGDFLDSLTASLSSVASTSLSRVAAMLAPSLTPPDQDPRIASGPPGPSKPAGAAEEAHPGSPPPAESMPAPSPTRPGEEARAASPPPVESMPAQPPVRPAEEARPGSPPPDESMPAASSTRRTEEARSVSPPPAAPAPPRPAGSATAPTAAAATAPRAVPSPPTVTARPPTSAASLPPRPAAPRQPARASEPKPEPKPEQKATAQKPVKERSVAQSTRAQDERTEAATPKPLTGAGADVIAQLSVQDRQEARRDIGLLLARLGGSRKAERESTVWLEVPRSRYGEFTRGLAQIGAWQTEQGNQPLPDPVAVTVILTR